MEGSGRTIVMVSDVVKEEHEVDWCDEKMQKTG